MQERSRLYNWLRNCVHKLVKNIHDIFGGEVAMQCKTPGDILRKLRIERGLTQKAVADALHVDRATYSFHETGKTQPNLCRIGELAKIFAIPVEVLVDLLANPEKTERSRPKSRRRRGFRPTRIRWVSSFQRKSP